MLIIAPTKNTGALFSLAFGFVQGEIFYVIISRSTQTHSNTVYECDAAARQNMNAVPSENVLYTGLQTEISKIHHFLYLKHKIQNRHQMRE